MQRQSAPLCALVDVFSFNNLNLNIPALSFWQRTPRDLSETKRNCTPMLSTLWAETTPGAEHFELSSQLPTAPWLGS